ncbi:MAG TPA: hypothetical protein VK179_14700 [Bacteroidales bacterium]|nr:hypothetical protein [Bacteroidales bacterium]
MDELNILKEYRVFMLRAYHLNDPGDPLINMQLICKFLREASPYIQNCLVARIKIKIDDGLKMMLNEKHTEFQNDWLRQLHQIVNNSESFNSLMRAVAHVNFVFTVWDESNCN